MLVLSRKVGEEIRIGNNVRVRVLEIRGNRVKLGFVAPEEVTILRSETKPDNPEPATIAS